MEALYGERDEPMAIRRGDRVRIKRSTFFCTVLNIQNGRATLWDDEVSKIRTKKEPLNKLLIVDY